MFKKFQQTLNRAVPRQTQQKLNQTSVSVAHQLLSQTKRQQLCVKYKHLLSFSEENFQQFAQPLLNNFAEFVQLLPETRNSYYSKTGGMLDHALERSYSALEKCRAYFLPGKTKTGVLTQPQTLWAYTLFSAAIFYGIGKIITDLSVELTDKYGKLIGQWHPLNGSMLKQSSHYNYDFKPPGDDAFKRRLTLLLARQLMPESGFRWIATDNEVLRIWLALLDGDVEGSGTWGPILIQSDAEAIISFFHTLEPSPGTYSADGAQFTDINSMFSTDSTDHGKGAEAVNTVKAFLEWLNKTIESGKLNMGQAPLHSVPGGLLMTEEVFKLFSKASSTYKNWQSVQAYFTGMGLHRMGPSDKPVLSYIHLLDKSKVEGVLVNPYLAKQNLSAAEIKTMEKAQKNYVADPSAKKVTQTQYVSPNGQWAKDTTAAGQTSTPTSSRGR